MSNEKVSDTSFISYIESFGESGVLQSELVSHFDISKGRISQKITELIQLGFLRKEKLREGKKNLCKIFYIEENLSEEESDIKDNETIDGVCSECVKEKCKYYVKNDNICNFSSIASKQHSINKFREAKTYYEEKEWQGGLGKLKNLFLDLCDFFEI